MWCYRMWSGTYKPYRYYRHLNRRRPLQGRESTRHRTRTAAVSLSALAVMLEGIYRLYRQEKPPPTASQQLSRSTLGRLRQRASLLALLLSLVMVGGRKVKFTQDLHI